MNPVFDGITSEVASPRRRFLFAGASFSEASVSQRVGSATERPHRPEGRFATFQ